MAALTTANHWKRSQCVWFRSSDSFDVAYLFNGEPTNVIRDNIVTVEIIVWIRISARLSGHMAPSKSILYHCNSFVQKFHISRRIQNMAQLIIATILRWKEMRTPCNLLMINIPKYRDRGPGSEFWKFTTTGPSGTSCACRFLSPLQDVFVCVCVCPLSLAQS